MNNNIVNYFKNLNKPPLDRSETKYYEEMQLLAYNLVKYLKMNEDNNEKPYQGNYNFTYLRENMTENDFEFIAIKFLKNIPLCKLKQLIKENFQEDHYDYLFKEELLSKIEELEKQLNKIKNILNCK